MISFSKGIFPTQGLNLCFLCLLALTGIFFTTEPPENPRWKVREYQFIFFFYKYVYNSYCLPGGIEWDPLEDKLLFDHCVPKDSKISIKFSRLWPLELCWFGTNTETSLSAIHSLQVPGYQKPDFIQGDLLSSPEKIVNQSIWVNDDNLAFYYSNCSCS